MTCPHLKKKIFVDFLTSMLLRAQNTTLLSKVRQRFFSNFVAFSESPNFKFDLFAKISILIKLNNYVDIFLSILIGAKVGQIGYDGQIEVFYS